MEVEVKNDNFTEEVVNSAIPVLVDFWAPWCMPCLMVAPILKEIAEEYAGKIKICKLNVDEAQDIAANYQIMSIPTMMIFKDGQVKAKSIGALPKSELKKFVEANI